jgi:lipopolysaccharide transport system permease protein
MAHPQAVTELPVTRIRPAGGWISLGLRDVWHYRELIGFLAMREVRVRYKQTLLGVAWIALHPLATTAVFSFIFGRLAGMPSDGLPYPVFAMSGLVAWNFFASAFSRGTTSVIGSADLISKVYFPRLIIPIASVLSPFVDVAVSIVMVILLGIFYGLLPGPQVVMVLPFIVLALVTALGMALWMSSLNVRFRDVGQILPIMTQLWFYATPVIYPASLFPERFRALQGLNPIATVAEGFRWALLGKSPPAASMVWLSIAVAVTLLVTGAYVFRRLEQTFADVV